ncbi:hypothetical protein IVA80_03605 [Bradyrhizobium sp. 139]|uniref:hypothetical protein n=1 Tax=Bradyrhizobium sp. 139 TaxID=2782616 RepID=UPI001FF804C0|nr:hypothetical protein [Bradyrhizobium sp. 139]MCK1739988.1 hypothetical protein [Bradyrhizobium sp. 139]
MSAISHPSKAASQISEEQGIIAFIMSALHASRRRQAGRVIRQYEHLLGNEPEREWSLRAERRKQD